MKRSEMRQRIIDLEARLAEIDAQPAPEPPKALTINMTGAAIRPGDTLIVAMERGVVADDEAFAAMSAEVRKAIPESVKVLVMEGIGSLAVVPAEASDALLSAKTRP